MALEVVGAGFGRTGTLSLKLALEELGLGPCHHMMEVFRQPDTIEIWQKATNGEAVDWATLMAGYRSAVDWPSAAFWRELALANPQAKVLLSVRDPEKWWESATATIFRAMDEAARSEHEIAQRHSAMALQLIRENTFGGTFEKGPCVDAFNRHVAWVRACVPADRLIVYEVGDGWGPLCEGLGLPVPDKPYPSVNSRDEFQKGSVAQAADRYREESGP